MNTILIKLKDWVISVFKKSKKIVELPQGKEYERWLGV
jgi:hypothetical protein